MTDTSGNSGKDTAPLTADQYKAAAANVQFMSPEIEARFKSGPVDPGLMQLAAECVSTQQLIQRASSLGMLANIQSLFPDEVGAFKQQQAQAKADEDKFERRTAEALAMMPVMLAASSEAQAAPAPSESDAKLAAAMAQYQEQRYSADYWSRDFARLMTTDPATAHAIIAEEKKGNETGTDSIKKTSADLQKAIDEAEAFKKANAGNPNMAAYMKVIDKGEFNPLDFACFTDEVQDKLLQYTRLHIAAQEARLLCGGDECAKEEKNPALKLLRQQRELIDRLDKVNDSPTATEAEKKAAADAYGNFTQQNKAFLQAIEKGNDKEAMRIAAEQSKNAPTAAAKADLEGGKAVEKAMTEQVFAEKARTVADDAKLAAANKPQKLDDYGEPELTTKAATAAPPTAQVAQAADDPARPKTIAADALGPNGKAGLALLGAQEVAHVAPEAANDPKAMQPVQAKPASAMGGMG